MNSHIILLTASIIFLLIAVGIYINFQKILKQGVAAEGIIFSIQKDSTGGNIQLSLPVIRFTTLSGEWITEIYKVGLFPGFYKAGDKVTVVYDADNRKNFCIKIKVYEIDTIAVIYHRLCRYAYFPYKYCNLIDDFVADLFF